MKMRGRMRHTWCTCCDDGIRPTRTRERAAWRRELRRDTPECG